MVWNWLQPNWPNFIFKSANIVDKERLFLLELGASSAYLKNIDNKEYKKFVVEILSQEGIESSRIEGEFLDRESLQSSIKKHFGFKSEGSKKKDKESGMALLLYEVYETFDQPLTHKMLERWHNILFTGQSSIEDKGRYRTHEEAMQIISNRYDSKPRIHFEAPPSNIVKKEMSTYINWFNKESLSLPTLVRAAVAHVYFECIHPFEDGNGRIGRLLIEKVLSQNVNRPVLIAVSGILEKRQKDYYKALEKCNHSLDVSQWVDFFTEVVLQAQKESMKMLLFLIKKSKLMNKLEGELNERQEKVLLSLFAEGVDGFQGGLSSENYIAITKTSRATATRDLSDLVQKEVLIKTGELRHTRYWINLNET
jgi:Fic family protein